MDHPLHLFMDFFGTPSAGFRVLVLLHYGRAMEWTSCDVAYMSPGIHTCVHGSLTGTCRGGNKWLLNSVLAHDPFTLTGAVP